MCRSRSFIALFLLALLPGLYSESSAAEDFYWLMYSNGIQGIGSTPDAAAAIVFSALNFQANGSCTFSGTSGGQPYYDCPFKWLNGSLWQESFRTVYRRGSGCSEPAIYNSTTHSCETPPPECPVGDPGIFSTGNGPVIESGGRLFIAHPGLPENICYNQCSYTRSAYSQSCYLSRGSTTEGFCNYIGTSTGENCAEPDAPLGKTGDSLNPPETPDVPPSDPNDPGCSSVPGYVWSGTTCVKDPGDGGDSGDGGDPGDGGGDGGGPGDGGGDGGGPGDGGGDGGGTGPGDGGGDGGGTGPGDGDGEGDGECDPSTDPNKCGQSSVAGESCDAELSCEGDVIQCAILRANKTQICQWKYDEQVRSEIAAELAGEAYQLEEKSIAVGGLFTEAVNKGRWLPQSCPSPQSFTVMGRSYSFSWEPACRFAEAIGPLIVALASIFFAVSIARGIKGS